MQRLSDRCQTSSGPYRCSRLMEHQGECVTRAPSTPWVGPARMPIDVSRAEARLELEHRRRVETLQREVRRADTRASNAEARAAMTHVVMQPLSSTATALTEEVPRA